MLSHIAAGIKIQKKSNLSFNEIIASVSQVALAIQKTNNKEISTNSIFFILIFV